MVFLTIKTIILGCSVKDEFVKMVLISILFVEIPFRKYNFSLIICPQHVKTRTKE